MKKLGLIFKETSEELIKNRLKDSESLIVLSYAKISGLDLGLLRLSLRNANAKMLMVKNSVARRALKDSEAQGLVGVIDGPCGLIFVGEEPVNASKVLCEFIKTHELVKLCGGLMREKILASADFEALAKLPTRDVMRAKAVSTLKSPLFGLVMVLNSTLKKIVVCLEQIKNKKSDVSKQSA